MGSIYERISNTFFPNSPESLKEMNSCKTALHISIRFLYVMEFRHLRLAG